MTTPREPLPAHAHSEHEDADAPVPCLASSPAATWRERGIQMPMPALADEEGPRVDPGLPPVVDAHVHLFPDRVFEAVWRWFDRYGWPIRYKLHTPHVLSFLLSRGVERVVALHYAHKPGMARALNAFVAEVAKAEPRVIGLGTVYPGEPGAVAILEEAFALGLKGVKLHCHVQAFSPDAPQLNELYEACARAGRPLVMHSGREPSSAQYPVDPHQLCAAERVERVLKDHPTLKLCVPHLGADEFDAYARLLERHDTLWLDTTMAVGGYFPVPLPKKALEIRPERILYGTDFPNIPYAWDRELRALAGLGLDEAALAGVLGGNTLSLYGEC
ncbi:amidohydrolase family protein [Corallococcus coralloides DSM 2259]|uniref:Amidohydrolase family protein n=1 Tax=Corallococcus coralloides (strain ATCC 25202 / DSM 2259 / NBRC 100086 / M2) TaxID=1144275 RepID=H8MS15_CORCM|nr:amidohydrolase family protein [Corallococcus coralloides]AFE03974.1 amidohydrolase family protein [Corallococcus coralloides DSM 2259]